MSSPDGERNRALWLWLSERLFVAGAVLVGIEKVAAKTFRPGSGLMLAAYGLGALSIACFFLAVLEVPLPRSVRVRLPRRRIVTVLGAIYSAVRPTSTPADAARRRGIRTRDEIQIEVAVYGPDGRSDPFDGADVFKRVTDLVRSGVHSFVADNKTLVGSDEDDPYLRTYKSLYLVWSRNGGRKAFMAIFPEEGQVDLQRAKGTPIKSVPRRRVLNGSPSPVVIRQPSPFYLVQGLASVIDEVETLAHSADEPAARSVYDSRVAPRALALFDQACELGYSPTADHAKLEQPISLTQPGLLLSLLNKLREFAQTKESELKHTS